MKQSKCFNQIKGFTLLELMITIAILAIVVAVAIPSYREQVVRSNRTEALDELLRQAAFQQRQYTINNQYSAVATYNSQNGHYSVSTALANANQSYTLTATPQGSQTEDSCGTLTINNLGQKTSSIGDPAACWAGRRG